MKEQIEVKVIRKGKSHKPEGFFNRDLEREFDDLIDTSIIEWAMNHIDVKAPQGGYMKMGFNKHKYLEAIYNEKSKDIVIQKSAQMGISTMAIARACYYSMKRGFKVLYCLDTNNRMKDFVNDKIDPILDGIAHASSIMVVDNVQLKRFRHSGSMHFRGLEVEGAALSIDADVLVLDELDRTDLKNAELAKDRILSSYHGEIIRVSQPTTPEFGINEAFLQSDRNYWIIKCPCGIENDLVSDFVSSGHGELPCFLIKRGDAWIKACKACHRELNVEDGYWKPMGDGILRGYLVSQLYGDMLSADKLVNLIRLAKKPYQRQRLYNSIIGIPYSDKELVPVTDAVLHSIEKSRWLDLTSLPSYMGVDVGDIVYYVIGHKERNDEGNPCIMVHNIGTVSDVKDLYPMFEKHNIQRCFIDAMPYKPVAKDLACVLRNKVYLQYFTSGREGESVKIHNGCRFREVKVNREVSLDETTSMIVRGEILIPNPWHLSRYELDVLTIFERHLRMLQKIKDEATGRIYYRRRVENHYGMALNSLREAAERGFDRRISTDINIVKITTPEYEDYGVDYGY